MAADRFAPELLERLGQAEEVRIETRRREGAARRTVIWVVVDDGEVFVRSVRGDRGRWCRELLADPVGALHVDGERIPVRAVAADDPASIERVSRALERKYAGDQALALMLRPHTLPTTLRLEPA